MEGQNEAKNEVPRAASSSRPGGGAAELRDATVAWGQADGGATTVEVVRLDANERILIPFTTSVAQVLLHYVEAADLRYVKCNGDRCVLCDVRNQVVVRDLLPVFDPIEQRIGVLPVSDSIRPHALRPVLARMRAGGPREAIAVRRTGMATFIVDAFTLPGDAADGAATIARFLEDLQAGAIDLADVYPTIADDDLRRIPEIARILKIRGPN